LPETDVEVGVDLRTALVPFYLKITENKLET
jgi:hypothetical protein